MPEFADVLTVLAVLTGPTGICLGWWLSERSSTKRASEAQSEARRAAELARVLESVTLARRVAADARSLAHGLYLKARGQVDKEQFRESIETFNNDRQAHHESILLLRSLGPSWIVKDAESFERQGQAMTQLMQGMQRNLSSTDVKAAEAALPALDTAVAGLVAKVAEYYNPDAASLPPVVPLDDLL